MHNFINHSLMYLLKLCGKKWYKKQAKRFPLPQDFPVEIFPRGAINIHFHALFLSRTLRKRIKMHRRATRWVLESFSLYPDSPLYPFKVLASYRQILPSVFAVFDVFLRGWPVDLKIKETEEQKNHCTISKTMTSLMRVCSRTMKVEI